MRVARLAIAVVVTGYAIAPHLDAQARLPVGPVPQDCNRACLEGLMNQYLDALAAKDPKRLPLSADVKYTEQEQVMGVGDGFWKTVTGRGNYNHYFADLVAGQVGWMGTMRERGGVLLMSVRLRVQLGRITEIEKSFFRAGGGGPNNIAAMDKQPQPETLWLQPIPAAQRASRHQLIAVANGYFEAVQKNDGKGYYPFTDDCDRLENGSLSTNVPGSKPTTPKFNYMGSGCKAQLESGYLGVKYSPDASTVWVSTACDDRRAVVRVRDEGIGIPAHEQSRVFDEFVRGDAAKRACIRGTGIGLAMVKAIIRAHRGDVHLSSEVGRGSTFELRLPLGDTRAGTAS
jgi:hypothetical protein